MLHIWTYTYSVLYAFQFFMFLVEFQWNKDKFENVFSLEVSETWAALHTASSQPHLRPHPSPLMPLPCSCGPNSLIAPDSGMETSGPGVTHPNWDWWEKDLCLKSTQNFGLFSAPWTANSHPTLHRQGREQIGQHTHPSWWLRSYRGSESSGCHRSR